MPILNEKLEFAVALTDKCNWNCPYCAVQNDFDRSNLFGGRSKTLEFIKCLPAGAVVTFYGGEPGLAPREFVEECIVAAEQRNLRAHLETNGEFILRYPDLVPRFETVICHCSENLEDRARIFRGFDNVRHLVVATDENAERLERLFDDNPDIRFDVVPASYPHGITGPTISERTKKEILARFARRLTRESAMRLIKDKDFEKVVYMTDGRSK